MTVSSFECNKYPITPYSVVDIVIMVMVSYGCSTFWNELELVIWFDCPLVDLSVCRKSLSSGVQLVAVHSKLNEEPQVVLLLTEKYMKFFFLLKSSSPNFTCKFLYGL